MDIRIRPRADRDIDGHAAYFSQEAGRVVALRFLKAMEGTLTALAAEPALGNPRHFDDPRLEGLRARTVAGFRKVRVFYLTLGDAVEIVRVLHGARDIPPLLDER